MDSALLAHGPYPRGFLAKARKFVGAGIDEPVSPCMRKSEMASPALASIEATAIPIQHAVAVSIDGA